MDAIWVLIANSTNASIYSVSSDRQEIKLISHLSHQESRWKNDALIADSAGRFNNRPTEIGSSYEGASPKEHEVEKFSKEIAKFLEKGRVSQAYIGIIVIAEPHFYGKLKQNCSSDVQMLIKFHLAKEYRQCSAAELQDQILNNLKHEVNMIFT
jgi:protein required for attachment to host cells